MAVVTRFAPSPTGPLHLGHVYAALFARQAAAEASGRFLVRLEDIDSQRCRPEFAAAALEDLRWLGLLPDHPVRRQSCHLPEYRAVLEAFWTRGLTYPCFCSRADIRRELADSASAPHAPDGAPVYPGTCRKLSGPERHARLDAGQPHAWRLDIATACRMAPNLRFHDQALGWVDAHPAPFGDVVLGRRDAPVSYHLCVTHDDAVQGITLVTRGEDLRPATHLHVLLQWLAGWPSPAYAHHRLLAGDDGIRLSKRNGAVAIQAMRDAGWSPEAVLSRASGASSSHG